MIELKLIVLFELEVFEKDGVVGSWI